MKTKIVIIGGGISGLSLLHFLSLQHAQNHDVEIKLFEKENILGGKINSISHDGCVFETGPNGFLDSAPRTLELIKFLKLEDRLIEANLASKMRYISTRNKLFQLPSNPLDFLFFRYWL